MNRELFAECFGTFGLVFAGTGAIIIDQLTGGSIGHAGISLTFGLVVMAMIYAFGDISGAHLNPAVTIAFVFAGRFPAKRAPLYLMSQIAGAMAASGVLHFLFPSSKTLGGTFPNGPMSQSFVLEVILTAMLMLVILSVSTGAKEKGITAGMAIGGVVGLEAMFAGPICGASMNPARSLAPAIISGHPGSVWLYLAAPVAGALLAVPLCRLVRGGQCCRTDENSPLPA